MSTLSFSVQVFQFKNINILKRGEKLLFLWGFYCLHDLWRTKYSNSFNPFEVVDVFMFVSRKQTEEIKTERKKVKKRPIVNVSKECSFSVSMRSRNKHKCFDMNMNVYAIVFKRKKNINVAVSLKYWIIYANCYHLIRWILLERF